LAILTFWVYWIVFGVSFVDMQSILVLCGDVAVQRLYCCFGITANRFLYCVETQCMASV